jgi:hypothetical protein
VVNRKSSPPPKAQAHLVPQDQIPDETTAT